MEQKHDSEDQIIVGTNTKNLLCLLKIAKAMVERTASESRKADLLKFIVEAMPVSVSIPVI